MVDQEPLRATPEPFVSKPDPLFLSNGKPVTEDALIDIHELNRQDSGLRVLFDEIRAMAQNARRKEFVPMLIDRTIRDYKIEQANSGQTNTAGLSG